MTYQTTDNTVTRSYSVDDDLIIIELNSGSSRTDSDLVMRIQHQGEVLTCNMCPAMQLSNVWTRVEGDQRFIELEKSTIQPQVSGDTDRVANHDHWHPLQVTKEGVFTMRCAH